MPRLWETLYILRYQAIQDIGGLEHHRVTLTLIVATVYILVGFLTTLVIRLLLVIWHWATLVSLLLALPRFVILQSIFTTQLMSIQIVGGQ